MSAANVAARLARREVVRRPWRSLIVLLLVLVPVVVLTGLAVIVRTNDRPHEESWTARWGQADIAIPGRSQVDATDELGGAVADPVSALAQAGDVRRLDVQRRQERLRTTDKEREWAHFTDMPLDDPMLAGIVDDLEGRLPSGPGEVLLSTPLADDLDLTLGDTLSLERPTEFDATVVGTATWVAELSRRVVVVDGERGGEALAALLGSTDPGWGGASTWSLLDVDDAVLDSEAWRAVSQHHDNRFGSPFDDSTSPQVVIVWSWLGGAVAFVIVGVVIAAAFAVTARRQLRLIGQLMGNGASERTLRATLFLQGTVIGLVGGILGAALGVGGLVAFEPLVERLMNRRLDGYDVALGDLVPIVVLATLAGTVAAVVPARTAVRTSVLQALAGRRPVGPYPNKLVLRGAIAAAGGLVLLAVATAGAGGRDGGPAGGDTWLFVVTGIGGAVAVILGTCAMSPAIISRLEPLAGWLRGTARLAARSVARQRARTGAIVAAVAVVAAGAVAGSTVWLTAEEADADTLGWQLPGDVVTITMTRQVAPAGDPDGVWHSEHLVVPEGILDQALGVLPGSDVIEGRTAVVPESTQDGEPWEALDDPQAVIAGPDLVVVDDRIADVLGLDPALRDALDRTGLVVHGWTPEGDEARSIEPQRVVLRDAAGRATMTVEGTSAPWEVLPHVGALVTEDRARELGLLLRPGRTILDAPSRLTEEQLDSIQDLQDDIWAEMNGTRAGYVQEDTTEWVDVWIERHDPVWEPSRGLITSAIVAVATLFSLGVVGLGLALSAAETKDERDVLAAIGAPPRTLRRLAAAKAAVLAVVGTVVGVPLGFVPTWVVARAAALDGGGVVEVVFPWLQVGLLVLVVPAVATAATVLASGVALRARPVQASSMAFD